MSSFASNWTKSAKFWQDLDQNWIRSAPLYPINFDLLLNLVSQQNTEMRKPYLYCNAKQKYLICNMEIPNSQQPVAVQHLGIEFDGLDFTILFTTSYAKGAWPHVRTSQTECFWKDFILI